MVCKSVCSHWTFPHFVTLLLNDAWFYFCSFWTKKKNNWEEWLGKSRQPPDSILCLQPQFFGGSRLNQLCSSGKWKVCPCMFLHLPLCICIWDGQFSSISKDWTESLDVNLSLLTHALMHMLRSKHRGPGCMFRVVVLLEGQPPAQSQVLYGL